MKKKSKKSKIIGVLAILLLPSIFQLIYVENTQKFTSNEYNVNHLFDTKKNPSAGFVLVDPIITDTPSSIFAELGYSEQSLSWTATDTNPNTYTIELQGSGIVAGPTEWTSGLAITYNIPEGFTLGNYIYIVNFTNDYGDFITDSVTVRVVEDTTKPEITRYHTYKAVSYGYIGQSLQWTARDLNPNTYTIELQGLGIVAEPTDWTSGVTIWFDIPDKLDAGNYYYMVTFSDDYGNSRSHTTRFTVNEREGGIPGASLEMILIMSIGAIAVIIIVKKKKIHSNLE